MSKQPHRPRTDPQQPHMEKLRCRLQKVHTVQIS
jgi:hypothetical protein